MMGEQIDTVSAEQAADLAALQSAAAVPAPGQPAPAAEPPKADLAGEIRALMLTFVSMAEPVLPCLPAIYTEETTAAAAQAIGALCEKHGWMQDGIMGDWAEEIAAAVVLLPLGFATVRGVQGDLARMKKPKPQEIAAPSAPVSDPAPVGSKEVVIGAPMPQEAA